MELMYKDNWNEAKEHYLAYWDGQYFDRPITLIQAPRESDITALPEPDTLEERWTNVDYQVSLDEANAARHHWLGDMIPTRTVLMGWCLAFDFPVAFEPTTIWFDHCMGELPESFDWSSRWQSKWWQKMCDYMEKSSQQGQGKYPTATPPILPPNDLLSVFRGTENFLMDLFDCPEIVKKHLREMTECICQMHQGLYDIRKKYYEGDVPFYPVWSPKPVGSWQSDMSCMISPDMYQEFIMPELEILATHYDNIIYHLDGPGAIQHVDTICSLDNIHTIQWVPGAGNPFGIHWMDLYKRIQKNGKSVLIYCSPNDLEPLIKELDPAKMILSLGAPTKERGEELVQRITELTKRYH